MSKADSREGLPWSDSPLAAGGNQVEVGEPNSIRALYSPPDVIKVDYSQWLLDRI